MVRVELTGFLSPRLYHSFAFWQFSGFTLLLPFLAIAEPLFFVLQKC